MITDTLTYQVPLCNEGICVAAFTLISKSFYLIEHINIKAFSVKCEINEPPSILYYISQKHQNHHHQATMRTPSQMLIWVH